MVPLDWMHARRRIVAEPTEPRSERPAASSTERGANYLAISRTLAAAQQRLDAGLQPSAPAGRKRAAVARLDRMYEVAMLVAAACDVAGVPPPAGVTDWPDELSRLQTCRDRNAACSRSSAATPPE